MVWQPPKSAGIQIRWQGTLKDGFKKAAALVVIYLEAGANNGVAFFLVNDFRHFIRVNSRDSRVKNSIMSLVSAARRSSAKAAPPIAAKNASLSSNRYEFFE